MLDGDASWKETIEDRLRRLEAVQIQSTTVQQIINPADHAQSESGFRARRSQDHQPNAQSTSTAEQHQNDSLDLSCSLGAFPASSIKALSTPKATSTTSRRSDSSLYGVLPEPSIKAHFDFYRYHLDRYLQHVLPEEDTIATIGARSPVLLNAICTAAAFCVGSADFQPCLDILKETVSRLLFSAIYHFDDVRALCIGALWIKEISAACHGLAVRVGASLDLHRCVTKMPHTKRDCYDRTRLHYIVCLVDHHCSLTYGRPPMTNEWSSLRNPRTFLQSLHCKAVDFGLVSQVEFWAISRRVFESFGADIERNLEEGTASSIQDLCKEYDQWRSSWTDVLAMRSQTNGESRRTFDLYFNCAKLSLLSHVFRGRARTDSQSPLVQTMEHQALQRALATVRCAFNHDDSKTWLQTLPTYFGTVISFACLFLVKVIRGEGIQVKQELMDESLELVRTVAKSLSTSPTGTAIAHQLHSIVQLTEPAAHAHTLGMENPAEPLDSNLTSMDLDLDFDQLMDTTFDWSLPGFDDLWMCSHDAQLDII